ncbi:MAG: nicotinate (nicotinamide) nucleotide adenylyltransferase [Candidatus Eremiobacteraeota bacterium]|nr:nicotinate (nicotinamide) nucleotide adenylyltransferase [Candidatus Eremiobacteraeota bacterium]MBV8355614.1 nicotinate (nicotinamide) nucleotide adenylyltransferase [Candidatus Eremiobacteraeota bacterium]
MRVGLFGGAFDPVHNAHLFIAEAVRSLENLDSIIFLPTGSGWHREPPRAPIQARAAMLRLAIAANPAFAVDLSDADESSTGFTADLIPRVRARFPDDAFFFVAGADSVASRWQRFDEVLRLLDGFLVAPRGRVTEDEVARSLDGLPAALRAKVRVLPLPLLDESATLVRERTEAGESVRYLVPEPVWRYIVAHGLYRARVMSDQKTE